jgi:hypothetical protein
MDKKTKLAVAGAMIQLLDMRDEKGSEDRVSYTLPVDNSDTLQIRSSGEFRRDMNWPASKNSIMVEDGYADYSNFGRLFKKAGAKDVISIEDHTDDAGYGTINGKVNVNQMTDKQVDDLYKEVRKEFDESFLGVENRRELNSDQAITLLTLLADGAKTLAVNEMDNEDGQWRKQTFKDEVSIPIAKGAEPTKTLDLLNKNAYTMPGADGGMLTVEKSPELALSIKSTLQELLGVEKAKPTRGDIAVGKS